MPKVEGNGNNHTGRVSLGWTFGNFSVSEVVGTEDATTTRGNPADVQLGISYSLPVGIE